MYPVLFIYIVFSQDIEDLHKVLAAILLISNIAFIEDEEAGLIIKDNHMSIYLKPGEYI